MVWNVVHNFPGAKDTYEVPVDYPTVGYDTIIASWFTDVFTSILAMQDVLIGEGALFLPKAGGTMTGDLILSTAETLAPAFIQRTVEGDVFKISTDEDSVTIENLIAGSVYLKGGDWFIYQKLAFVGADIEVQDKTKGLILKSPDNSRFRLEVSDGGVLSTEAL